MSLRVCLSSGISAAANSPETHLREVAYCDVIKRQMTSWLTLSGDIRQKLAFKENSGNFARIFINSESKYIFLSAGC